MIDIIEYQPRYQPDFRALNLEWLVHYNLLEPLDQEVIDDPQSTIIDKGGYIYLARFISDDGDINAGRIVGTAALCLEHDGIYEFAKMSVAPELRGQGIGNKLIAHCLEKARDLGIKKLMLWSNSRLQPAIAMYTKFGFRHIPVVDSPFVNADVKMELDLE